MNIYTYSNVKLSLEAWKLIEEVTKVRGCDTNEAIELMIRHGYIHYAKVNDTLTA